MNYQRSSANGNHPNTLAEKFGFKDPDLTTPKHDAIMMWLDKNVLSICEKWLKEHKEVGFTLHEKKWEEPITSGNYTIGFLDMYVSYLSEHGRDQISHGWGLDYESRDKDRRQFCFECKSSIPSLGELMRQINMYRTYVNGQFFVVSPDDGMKKMIENQGIVFIKCPK